MAAARRGVHVRRIQSRRHHVQRALMTTAGPDQASAHGDLVLFCGLHRRDSRRGRPGPLRVGRGADRIGFGRVRCPGGESWPLSADGHGSTTHRAALGELRYLSARVAGSIQQGDLWDAVRCGRIVRAGALVDVLTAILATRPTVVLDAYRTNNGKVRRQVALTTV